MLHRTRPHRPQIDCVRGPGGGHTPEQTAIHLAFASWRRGSEEADPIKARFWLERANRIAPADDAVKLSLALACYRGGDVRRAAGLFADLAARLDSAQAWLGLAGTAMRLPDAALAASAMQAALSRHATASASFALAGAVAKLTEMPGWCAIGADGRLYADAPAELTLDGRVIAPRWTANGCRLPRGRTLTASRAGVALLGSPIDLGRIAAVDGFAAGDAADLVGWAWHPRDPDRDPILELTFADGTRRSITARLPVADQQSAHALSRRRSFRISALDIPPGPVSITGSDGRDLIGSPVDPGMERRSAAGLEASFVPVWADVVGISPACSRNAKSRRRVDVVVPVHGRLSTTLACVDSVLPTLPKGSRLHVVDDASPDAALVAALDGMAAAGRIILHRLPRNLGYPAAANTGLRAAAGRDVVLLNSDTVVAPGWIEALAAAAYSAPWTGSACPLSNDATILSYPDQTGGNPMVDPAQLTGLAARANGAATVEIPVGVGFCMFMRRDCLDAVGLLREDLFAQGYGEENDWCLRARHRGWRHVAVPGCFVAHAGGASFGDAKRSLLIRNNALLERLHPGYSALIGDWIGRDPLGPARRRIDELRWQEGRGESAVVLVTQAGPGGVERVVQQRCAALRSSGVRPIVLRPDAGAIVVGDGATPNLRYRLPEEWDELLRLLKQDRVAAVELHHVLGHPPAITELAGRLGVPYDTFVHDYASFCARIALVARDSYCGEPPVETCEACVADNGTKLEEDIGPAALIERSAALLAASRHVVTPAVDVAKRIRRHFPAVHATVSAWEDDALIAPPEPFSRPVRHICVVGAIGVEKGYDVLLGCVRDAAARGLQLRFTVVGHTDDDERLFAAGPVAITGRYKEADADLLVREQKADVAFLPSIWPETWCFALSLAWRAGLQAVAFDLGAPAERIRRTGWGQLLPLGMSPAALNTWFSGGAPVQANRRDH